MRAALNIAVYYEMKDSLAKAEEWAEKAQQLAKKIDKKNKYFTLLFIMVLIFVLYGAIREKT